MNNSHHRNKNNSHHRNFFKYFFEGYGYTLMFKQPNIAKLIKIFKILNEQGTGTCFTLLNILSQILLILSLFPKFFIS